MCSRHSSRVEHWRSHAITVERLRWARLNGWSENVGLPETEWIAVIGAIRAKAMAS